MNLLHKFEDYRARGTEYGTEFFGLGIGGRTGTLKYGGSMAQKWLGPLWTECGQ